MRANIFQDLRQGHGLFFHRIHSVKSIFTSSTSCCLYIINKVRPIRWDIFVRHIVREIGEEDSFDLVCRDELADHRRVRGGRSIVKYDSLLRCKLRGIDGQLTIPACMTQLVKRIS